MVMEGASDGGAMGKQHASEVQCRVLCARVRGVPGLGWSEMWRENERRLGVRERERKGVWEDEEKRQMEYMMHAMTSLQTTYGGGGGGYHPGFYSGLGVVLLEIDTRPLST